jgi:glycosyltransferase involved in cell wall biosynthesis
LILCSKFEALPLVVLEALSLGVGVVATPVGGIPSLASQNLQGLLLSHGTGAESIAEALLRAPPFFAQQTGAERAQHNRKILSTWSDVAGCVLGAIKKVRP